MNPGVWPPMSATVILASESAEMTHENRSHRRKCLTDGVRRRSVYNERAGRDQRHETLGKMGSEIRDVNHGSLCVGIALLNVDFRTVGQDIPVVGHATGLGAGIFDHFVHQVTKLFELAVVDGQFQIPGNVFHNGNGGINGTSKVRSGKADCKYLRHYIAQYSESLPIRTQSMPRYQDMTYRRCGRSGVLFPLISLGLWHNFGDVDDQENAREMILHAFDAGITHFDLANNYGPPPGAAESNFGRILASDLKTHRDELIISSKAGYLMWNGPYGEWGSRKYLVASCDQSLKRLGLEYVDIFYSHRYDPDTPLEETMGALDHIVRSGRALYVGISNYGPRETKEAVRILRELGTPCLIHQPKYSMFERWIEPELVDVLDEQGIGCIPFSPLAQGMLTNKYLNGIPEGSRAAKEHGFLRPEALTMERMDQIRLLNDLASERGQTLAQMALQWVSRIPVVTSVLIGASRIDHLDDALGILNAPELSSDDHARIDGILAA